MENLSKEHWEGLLCRLCWKKQQPVQKQQHTLILEELGLKNFLVDFDHFLWTVEGKVLFSRLGRQGKGKIEKLCGCLSRTRCMLTRHRHYLFICLGGLWKRQWLSIFHTSLTRLLIVTVCIWSRRGGKKAQNLVGIYRADPCANVNPKWQN